jgi:hypothetical protein
MSSFLHRPVLAVTAILWLSNAAKPVTVDDTAYLRFAQHIAGNPLDPYGFQLHWYDVPIPAMNILAPPVVLYWLAGWIRLVGDATPVLKLAMLPFAWLLVRSIFLLLRRYAPGNETPLTLLVCLSPLVWPSLNLMLDLPALGLGLTAWERFLTACEATGAARGIRVAVLAGVLAGLAMQTKYTMFATPMLFLGPGLARRRFVHLALALAAAGMVFAVWEMFLLVRYEQSHFVLHALGKSGIVGARQNLLPGLICMLGGTMPVLVVLGMRSFASPRADAYGLLAAGVVYAAVLGACLTEARVAVLWDLYGFGILGTALLGIVAVLLYRLRAQQDSEWKVLAWWLLVELVAYFALSPFTAARRVLALAMVLGVIVGRAQGGRPIPRYLVALGILLGAGTAALDWLGAHADRAGVAAADRRIREQDEEPRVWFVGHWGWQYHAEAAGWKPIQPGKTTVARGDWIVIPDPNIHFEQQHFASRQGEIRYEAAIDVGDRVPLATLPTFYGGMVPFFPHDPPRLRVLLLRVQEPHVLQRIR